MRRLIFLLVICGSCVFSAEPEPPVCHLSGPYCSCSLGPDTPEYLDAVVKACEALR